MRTLKISVVLTLLTAGVMAQQKAAPPTVEAIKTFASAADVQALIAKEKADLNGKYAVAESLLKLEPYRVNLEYRKSPNRSSIHEKETELFYVVEGSATMITGGKLVKEYREGTNLHGSGIEGGTARNIAKGDFLIIPVNTPHYISVINGTIVLVAVHIPI